MRPVRTSVLVAVAVVLLMAASAAPAPAAGAATRPPQPTAPSAIVVDAATGAVLYERRADRRRAIASTTKLMTVLVARERLALSDAVPAARYRALPVESKINLVAGERMTVADLVRGLLLASANDAAATLAEAASGSRAAFVRDMNRKARRLGLRSTRFANPIGLDDPGNYSSARDLARLAREILRDPFLARTIDRPGATLKSGARARSVVNRNRLVARVPWVNGMKTGRTQNAGYVLVGSGRRKGVQLVSVVLGTPSEAARESDTLALLRYGFTRYRRATAIRRGTVLATAPVRYRRGADATFVAGRTVRRTIRKGQKLTYEVTSKPTEIVGALRRGQKVGEVSVMLDGEPITTVALVSATELPAAGVVLRLKDYFTRPWTMLLVIAGVVCLLQVGFLLRRRRRRRRSDVRPAARRREVEPA